MIRPVIFPVYPEIRKNRRDRFYRVYIFGSVKDANAFWRAQVKTGRLPDTSFRFSALGREFQGQCNWWRTRDPRFKRCVGQVLLTADSGSGLVAHEFQHASWFYLTNQIRGRWLRGKKPRALESLLNAWSEPLAQMTGDMVRQFWSRWWKLKDRGMIRSVRRA